jgi:hypothetical protein
MAPTYCNCCVNAFSDFERGFRDLRQRSADENLAMKNSCLAVLLLSCLTSTVCAQEQAPQLLVKATQCLEAKKHLPPSTATTLSFGYLVDSKSYPGEKVLYIVNYTGSDLSEGMVFAIFLEQHDGRRIFNIQNNAKFVRSKNDIEGVDFVEPPLGGIWTQEHLVAAIKRIERQPRFDLRVKDLLTPSVLTQCESYADRK